MTHSPPPQLARTHPVALQHRDGCRCRSHLPTQCVLIGIAQRQVCTKGILPGRTIHTCTHNQTEGGYPGKKAASPGCLSAHNAQLQQGWPAMFTHPVALQHRDGCSCRSHLPAQCVLVSIAQRQVRAKGILQKTMQRRSSTTQQQHMEKGGGEKRTMRTGPEANTALCTRTLSCSSPAMVAAALCTSPRSIALSASD